MVELIDRYFALHLSLPPAEATRLHQDYYKNYGLAIEGLVRHHQIDPLEYNARVDDALPLDSIIRPREDQKRLLRAIDRSRVRPWLLTNAYINHGRRVVRLLEIEELFEGITFCDYASVPFVCKPARGMYEKAMREAGICKHEDCYFVGMSPATPMSPCANGPAADTGSLSPPSQMTLLSTARRRRHSAGTQPILSKRARSCPGRRLPDTRFGTLWSCAGYLLSCSHRPAKQMSGRDRRIILLSSPMRYMASANRRVLSVWARPQGSDPAEARLDIHGQDEVMQMPRQ